VQSAIEKAGVLLEALPYIQRFRERFVVIKLGGSVMDDRETMAAVLTDVAFMEQVGMWPVVVHGGGPRISARMKEAGFEPTFVDGRRVTDAVTLEIAQKVLIDEISAEIVEHLAAAGGHGIALNGRGSDFLHATKRLAGGHDLGFVGEVSRVEREIASRASHGGLIPVVAPIARGEDGNLYNVNADSAAARIASEIGAEKLVFLSNVPGVLERPGDDGSLLSTLRAEAAGELVQRGVVAGGMQPKVEAGLEALRAGVHTIHIVAAALRHALLLEIFTDTGVGTQILAEGADA